jgi:hypothetical protein
MIVRLWIGATIHGIRGANQLMAESVGLQHSRSTAARILTQLSSFPAHRALLGALIEYDDRLVDMKQGQRYGYDLGLPYSLGELTHVPQRRQIPVSAADKTKKMVIRLRRDEL